MILHVDLTRKKILKQDTPYELVPKYLGGRGVNAWLLWYLANDSRIDPLGPGNPLIFGPGALAGSSAPASGRTTVTCKGAATGLYLKSSIGGHWGAELKSTSIDHLIILGASGTPVFLAINDDSVEVKDASHLWGLDVRETESVIKRDLGDNNAKVACIGPAGEKLVLFASIMNTEFHAAARGGVGAVMGSKKLKAIAVTSAKRVVIQNSERFNSLALKARTDLMQDSSALSLARYGTSGGIEVSNEQGNLPVQNYRFGVADNVSAISGVTLLEEGYVVGRRACFSCPIACHRYTKISSGKHAGSWSGGPEFETCAALGSLTGVFETETLLKANELCNRLGMDTISTGQVISWAMESFERGVLSSEDTDGIRLRFGNSNALLSLIEKIAHRSGEIGSLLGDGLKRATAKVGKDSWKWAMFNSKGLEQSMVDTRVAKGYALAFAVNPRGPDHLHTQVLAEFGDNPEGVRLIGELTGDKAWATPYRTEYRAEIVRWHEDCYAVADSLGFCSFVCTAAYTITPQLMAGLFQLATGIEMTQEKIMNTGRRIVNLERCFNVRLGANRRHDDLPWRMMHEPSPAGPGKGLYNSRHEMDRMLDRYYELHGWDVRSGKPHKETLESLDLADVAAELRDLPRRKHQN